MIGAVYAFCGVLMLGVILNWIDSKALRVDYNECHGMELPKEWFTWIKIKTRSRKTGLEYELYMMVVRLPSYAWAYQIWKDDYGWMQNAIVWMSRNTNDISPNKGLSIQQLTPLARAA